jgi:hypothetical protein
MYGRHYTDYFKEEQDVIALEFQSLCPLVLQVKTGRKQTKTLTYIDSLLTSRRIHFIVAILNTKYVYRMFFSYSMAGYCWNIRKN